MQHPFFTSTLKAPARLWRWRVSLLTMILLGGLTPAAQAQVPAGTYTIGTAPYTSIAAAIALMNSGTGVAGNVIFNVPAGYTETFATSIAGRITTATTTATKTVVFQKSGAGTNPPITMAATAGTGTLDAIISLVGTDYVTFDGISVSDANSAAAKLLPSRWNLAMRCFGPPLPTAASSTTLRTAR